MGPDRKREAPRVTDLASRIDATLLDAASRGGDVDGLVADASRLGCAAVCVLPVHVARAARAAAGSGLRVASVAGFPLGASPVASKLAECRHAIENGAHELDVVMPIWAAVDGRFDLVEEELRAILAATRGATLKVILEVSRLDAGSLARTAEVLHRVRPAFAKTGTGYERAVRPSDVRALRRLLDPSIAIKAAGGIRTRERAEALVRAGADRLGSSRPGDLLAGE